MSSIQSSADFFTPPAPARTVRVSEAVFTSLRDSFALDGSATTDDVQAELEKLGEAARAKPDERKLVGVQRRGPLPAPLATRKPARLMRAAPRGRRASLRP